jgi:hypothetical protein
MRRPWFDPKLRRVGFVVDKVTLRQAFSEYLYFLYQFSFHEFLPLGRGHNKETGNRISDNYYQPELNTTKLNSVVLVRKRTIPTERPQPVGEVNANFS